MITEKLPLLDTANHGVAASATRHRVFNFLVTTSATNDARQPSTSFGLCHRTLANTLENNWQGRILTCAPCPKAHIITLF